MFLNLLACEESPDSKPERASRLPYVVLWALGGKKRKRLLPVVYGTLPNAAGSYAM